MNGTSDEKEEVAETLDPQSCSSSNRASMDGTGDEEEEEAWMVPAMRKKKKWERLMDPSSPNYRMFCSQGRETGGTQTLSHQKFDAIYTYFRS